MPPSNQTTPATAAGRKPVMKSTPSTSTMPAGSRVTRLRAAKDTPGSGSPALPSAKPSGLLARGKEGFRKVSDKMKEKEREKKEVEKKRVISSTTTSGADSSHTESLQAFLRIRPPPTDASQVVARSRPYLEPQGEKEAIMRAPLDPNRPHAAPKPPLIYSFNRVFPPSTNQDTFFTLTTLPLVQKLLQGENGLMFAYGVSNSGKSYTISGGKGDCEATDRGVLPRSIDVVFNSIKGLESKAHLKCVGLADIELVDGHEEPAGLFDHLPAEAEGCTQEAVKVDRNYSYAVFVSYTEVYNEKIFDLLDSVLPVAQPAAQASNPKSRGLSTLPRASSAWGLSGHLNSSMNLAALANGGGGVIRRRALALKNDPEGSGKYISGLNEIRVRTRDEALAVFRAGQRARQVFGTLANRESSRSHGIFTIKTVKIHNGAPDDPESAQVSRLAIVDLAGSERTRNTGTTGERLKEAGNINKSLMVLGQCLEVLRSNQQKLAAPAVAGSKKKLAMVPFRHSKLTEIFQNFFVGDGRAVMIVNVNPYDTGFDENSHVMRFSAVAREVQTTASNKIGFPGQTLRRQISTQFSALKHAVSGPMKIKVVVPVLPKEVEGREGKVKLAVQRERESDDFVMVEEELEVVEEDAESESEDERDGMVDHLFEQLRELKERLFESEMRNATIEVEVREEMAHEMQETMERMHADFNQRLADQVSAGEMKTDKKIDILSRTIATPAVERTYRGKGTITRIQSSEGLSFLSSTPPIDVDTSRDSGTMDASFESAIDESLLEGSVSPIPWRPQSDPFIVDASPLRKRVEVDDEDEDDVLAIDDSHVADISHEGDVTLGSVEGDTSQESDDILQQGDITGTPQEEELDEDEEEDDDDDETEAEQETDSEDEEEEEVEDSDFTISETSRADVSLSISPEPIRRQSTKRRQTTTTPSRKAQASPAKSAVKPGAGKSTPAKLPRSTPAKKLARSPTPLQERLGQDGASDEEVDEQPVKSAKKKRTLGKKIVMEDEILREDVRVPGAEIKRMGSRNNLLRV